VQDGFLPPEDAVRAEEFVNYFNYHYPNPSQRGETFAIHVDGAPSPVLDDDASHRMMRVGIQGYAVPADERPNANLTFVIDVSGSMDMENRLGLAKRALYLLVDELRPTDQVAIVVYGSTRRTWILPMTSAEEKQTILRRSTNWPPEGSTNAAAGLELGYEVAAGELRPRGDQPGDPGLGWRRQCRADRIRPDSAADQAPCRRGHQHDDRSAWAWATTTTC
jgi:Ca-activated chloride channel family protein